MWWAKIEKKERIFLIFSCWDMWLSGEIVIIKKLTKPKQCNGYGSLIIIPEPVFSTPLYPTLQASLKLTNDSSFILNQLSVPRWFHQKPKYNYENTKAS